MSLSSSSSIIPTNQQSSTHPQYSPHSNHHGTPPYAHATKNQPRQARGNQGGRKKSLNRGQSNEKSDLDTSNRSEGKESEDPLSNTNRGASRAKGSHGCGRISRQPGERQNSSGARSTDGSSRRGNANHLLNFQFQTPSQGEHRNFRGKKKKTSTFKKEAYLQANCHFVLSPGVHAESMSNPDHSVDWMVVEQVILPTDCIPSCPICLQSPVAPKMTKCGHFYCTVCITHYLSLGQHSWSRCPLCFEAVYKRALKSVEFRLIGQYKPQDVAEFFLMKRERGSIAPTIFPTLKLNKTSTEASAADTPASLFARITISNDISDIIQKERGELEQVRISPATLYFSPFAKE